MRALSEIQHACRLVGLARVYGKGATAHHALDQIDLSIKANEFFTLLGPSGCGKTTLLRLIGGFDQPTSGQIAIFGRDVAGLPPEDRPVNTVFQHYALFPHLTVAQNIGFALRMLGRPKAEIAVTVARMVALVGLEGMEGRKPDQLSRVGKSSGSPWRGRWHQDRRFFCWTSRCRRSMPNCGSVCGPS